MRKRTPFEELFDELADATSRIIVRAIMLFPFCLVGGTYITIKLLRDIFNSELWLVGMSIGISIILYLTIITFIYDLTLEKYVKRICLSKMHHMERYVEEIMNSDNELAKRKLTRQLKLTAEGRLCIKRIEK